MPPAVELHARCFFRRAVTVLVGHSADSSRQMRLQASQLGKRRQAIMLSLDVADAALVLAIGPSRQTRRTALVAERLARQPANSPAPLRTDRAPSPRRSAPASRATPMLVPPATDETIAMRKAAGLLPDSETAEICLMYGETLDRYGDLKSMPPKLPRVQRN
jgi:hypothetical protein